MDVTNISADIIENTQVDTKNLVQFLTMCKDYQDQLLMDELREDFNS